MAFCTKCGAQVPDGTPICPVCGAPIAAGPVPQQQPIPQQFAPPPAQPYQQPMPQNFAPKAASKSDHTAEFAKDDIKRHKGIAASFYAIIMFLFFLTLDGIGFTTLFTSLIDSVVAMFTRGMSWGTTGAIQAFAFMGIFIFIGTLAFKDSPYVKFHGSMAFKLLALSFVTYFLRIIPVAGPVLCFICTWLIIGIAFVSLILVIMGKAREPIIIEYIL